MFAKSHVQFATLKELCQELLTRLLGSWVSLLAILKPIMTHIKWIRRTIKAIMDIAVQIWVLMAMFLWELTQNSLVIYLNTFLIFMFKEKKTIFFIFSDDRYPQTSTNRGERQTNILLQFYRIWIFLNFFIDLQKFKLKNCNKNWMKQKRLWNIISAKINAGTLLQINEVLVWIMIELDFWFRTFFY